jgi:putative DNA methylase
VTERTRLIEVALPLESISAEGSLRKRKAPAGYPTTIHKWWAQRPPAACRAVIFASLVDDPSTRPDLFPTDQDQDAERHRLFDIIRRLIKWENSTDQTVLREARAEISRSMGADLPPLLDPFSGSGALPLEGQRLGLASYASDLNPVAVLITRALVDIPTRFADCPPVNPESRQGLGSSGTWAGAAGIAEDVLYYGARVRDEAERLIGHLYPKVSLPKDKGGHDAPATAWFWARTVTCPNPACSSRMPLVRSFALSTQKGRSAWVEPIVDRSRRTIEYEVRTGPGSPPAPTKVGRGSAFRCLVCEQVAPDSHVKSEGMAGRIGTQLMAIAVESNRGRVYVSPTAEHEAIARSADPSWAPTDELPGNARWFSPPLFGMTRYGDLFTPRQLVALSTLADLLRKLPALVLGDAAASGLPDDGKRLEVGGSGAQAYADAVVTYLALALDRVADYGNSLASWRPKDSAMRSLFARQAIPMVWDFAEGSPFGKSSSGWTAAVRVVARTLDFIVPGPMAHVSQIDARHVTTPTGAVVATDPPYYDNIGYADLSDFFHVWLRRSIGSLYTDLFSTLLTPKGPELVATPYRFGGDSRKADQFFEDGLRSSFIQLRELAHDDIPITLFYAFKQSEEDGDGPNQTFASTGWETMLQALVDAGLRVVGTWPLRTEGDNRAIGIGTNALASSIVLVCRKRGETSRVTTRRDFIAELTSGLPTALRRLQQESIAPVDLAQAAIGPGMAVFSQYAKVIEPDGSAMTVRSALGLINSALDQIVAEQEAAFDPDTRWAITWFDQHGMQEGPFDHAETLSKAKNISVSGLRQAGIIGSGGGKVRLLPREELPAGWNPATDRRPTVWEAAQHLVRILEREGETAAGEFVAQAGGYAELARDLAYRLFLVCERKGWAEEALAYNALVVAWPEIERLAQVARTGQQQQNLKL